MTLLAGPRWHAGRPARYWVRSDAGRVVEEGPGDPPGPAERVVLLDGMADWHTHVGDAFLQGRDLPHDLAALVAPGHGLKHKLLASTPRTDVVAGARRHLEWLAGRGVTHVLDFREQGAPGVALAREAARDLPLDLVLLGRPDPPDDAASLANVLRDADGIGIPSLHDWGPEACGRLVEAAHAAGRAVAFHVSEAVREPIDDVLALDPDLLVHACHAMPHDLDQIADAGVPLVLCPTSNAWFRQPTPDPTELEDRGIPWHLGADNAMLGPHDPLDQARHLHAHHPGVPAASLLRALTTSPRQTLKRLGPQSGTATPARVLLALPVDADGAPRWDAPPRRLTR